jgi:hypothetical protein
MKASRFNEEQIIAILREHEAGAKRPKCAGGTGSRTLLFINGKPGTAWKCRTPSGSRRWRMRTAA